MEYDVFISCKSEDYKYAEEIYQFLTDNGIHTFLASKELRNLGDSEYRRAISKAMKSAYHMIVFASRAEYIDSTWVYYEWDMFVNAMLKGFKTGQIMTILKGIQVDEINMDLWKYESFTTESYKEKLLSYVETPAYLKRKEEERQKEKEQEILRMQQQKADEEKRKAEALVIILAEEYRKKLSELQSVDIPKIIRAMKNANITHRKCPICGTEVELEYSFCPECSWSISPLEGIKGAEYLISNNPEQIKIAKDRHLEIKSIQNKIEKSENSFKTLPEKKDSEIKDSKSILSKKDLQNAWHLAKYVASNSISTRDQKTREKTEEVISPSQESPQKLISPIDISNIIIQSSSCTLAIFSHDKLLNIGFSIDKCIQILSNKFSLKLSRTDFNTCKTVADVKDMIADRAGLNLWKKPTEQL